MPPRLVLDTNIFLEVIFQRSLHDEALSLIRKASNGEVRIFEPSLVIDELAEVIAVNTDDMGKMRRQLLRFDRLVETGVVEVVTPSVDAMMQAIEIFRAGHHFLFYGSWIDSGHHHHRGVL